MISSGPMAATNVDNPHSLTALLRRGGRQLLTLGHKGRVPKKNGGKCDHFPSWGFSLEHPQGLGIVGIVGTVGIVGIVGIEFCRPEPRPTAPSVLVDISCYSYLKEQRFRYT